jgi:hypothetical protein
MTGTFAAGALHRIDVRLALTERPKPSDAVGARNGSAWTDTPKEGTPTLE